MQLGTFKLGITNEKSREWHILAVTLAMATDQEPCQRRTAAEKATPAFLASGSLFLLSKYFVIHFYYWMKQGRVIGLLNRK